ncbi:ATP-binding cassette subfamily C protein CydD [Sediminihabitans luteus]|uniref:ATP-binding cassette subfamily C protein CydD n=1 Tax=Sediminihabitans luteus TaxID=1138585 RepID=A0A2M9CPJ6_9CELL|nr:thiol reductant ABC exporter subunit CydD [Sediminihabitans luteus]PJJ73822.1 ATP-binding cassette subfamily C protein CydD [Sediminihabitans luteus]GIJ00499.1 thiol reductant ABC exporter subunit CydD [Sediminihabitans luteus]
MRPLDPRLLRHARAARGYVVLTAVLGLLVACLVIAQALLIARVLAPAIDGSLTDWRSGAAGTLALLCGVVALRALAAWAQERFAVRAAARTVAELREGVVAHATALGPRWLAGGRGPEVTTLATRGLDALEPYLVRYLPQLLLAATVTPLTLLVVLDLDWVSALVIVCTIPLVPLFMVLVGQLTAGTAERRLAVVQRLGSQVLDLLVGLPTLRAFGREHGPQQRVRALGDASRRATMGTLRVAFLSGMVLELLTTLSVAIVAVGVGLRLVRGEGIDLESALVVLILAPEVYLPLRQVGMHFHASTDGLAAAQQAFEILETPLPARGTRRSPGLRGATVTFDDVSVRAGDRDLDAPSGLGLTVRVGTGVPGTGSVVVLTGPSGAGKTTASLVLLGLLCPDAGRVLVRPAEDLPAEDLPADGQDPAAPPSDGTQIDLAEIDLAEIDPDTWWPQVTWVSQRPTLAPGTLRDAVTDGRDVDAALLDAAARATGLDEVVDRLTAGWSTPVGRNGVGLSVGQRQRAALAAALLDDPARVPLVVLDEPTAHLDARGEQAVLDTVRAMRDQGRTVVVVAHRASLVALADEVVTVRSAPVASPGRAPDPAEVSA